MISCSNKSTFEILPDEILLEICNYLSCSDVLQAFFGLNKRIKRMINQYCCHVSLILLSIRQFEYLHTNVFQHIGSQVISLHLDSDCSVLQDHLFMKLYENKISTIFSNLQRLSLVTFEEDLFIKLLNNLNNMQQLSELYLYSFYFNKQEIAQSIFSANNYRLTTIMIDEISNCLVLDGSHRYLNITKLKIKIRKLLDLLSLFVAVPNVEYLHVSIAEDDYDLFQSIAENNFSSLEHLTHFQLKSIMRDWSFEELSLLMVYLPNVKHLSCYLSTLDSNLLYGNRILLLLPTTIQQFNYAVYCFPHRSNVEINNIISSWPSSHPISCFHHNNMVFIHTTNWDMDNVEYTLTISDMMSRYPRNSSYFNRNVDSLDVKVEHNLGFTKILANLSRYPRLKTLRAQIHRINSKQPQDQLQLGNPLILPRLKRIALYGAKPDDMNSFPLFLSYVPKLSRISIPFEYLFMLFEDRQVCHLLGQRIKSLSIMENVSTTAVTLDQHHIAIIGFIFHRTIDFYFDIKHLKCCTDTVQFEDSSESMLLCILSHFKEHQLISICLDGNFCSEIKSDVVKWLQDNSHLREQRFEASFTSEFDLLLIWM